MLPLHSQQVNNPFFDLFKIKITLLFPYMMRNVKGLCMLTLICYTMHTIDILNIKSGYVAETESSLLSV